MLDLSEQVNWERRCRQIVMSLHATLDRDAVLQATVDSLGRALGVSRCFVVWTVGASLVTHEYVDSSLSPLGLGQTNQFPSSAISCFRHRLLQVDDLAQAGASLGLSESDLQDLLQGGVKSLIGAPISYQGHSQGIVVAVQTGKKRRFSNQEEELFDIVVQQAALALHHAGRFAQVQDQVFNLNLLSNLSQQLTHALELVNKADQVTDTESTRLSSGGTPLSARELEVLKLIASGLANREIAQKLFLTESTVELHASRIRKKLKLKSRTALVKYACDNQLV